MATIIEKTGKTVEEAIQAALTELGAVEKDVEVEVLENPSKGFFGFGAKPARVQVKLKEITQPVTQAEPQPISKFEVQVEETPEDKNIPEVTEKIDDKKISASETETEVVEEKISDFDKNAVVDVAKNFLLEVCAAMKIDVTVTAKESDAGIVLDLAGKNMGVLIGKHGQTLDALQYLTNLAANTHDAPEKIRFILDIENYRERRAETLEKLAKSVAERVIRLRQDVKLEPMSRHERKIIHTALQDNDKIETHSAGEDPYRYIVVSPKKRGR